MSLSPAIRSTRVLCSNPLRMPFDVKPKMTTSKLSSPEYEPISV